MLSLMMSRKMGKNSYRKNRQFTQHHTVFCTGNETGTMSFTPEIYTTVLEMKVILEFDLLRWLDTREM
jgi:hypothetical protein